MKIISKYKDYYDFLLGKYGVDPKLVLDRRKGGRLTETSPQSFKLAICGKLIDVFFDGEKCYCGDGLYKVGVKHESKRFKFASFDTEDHITVKIVYKTKDYWNIETEHTIYLNPKVEKTDIYRK